MKASNGVPARIDKLLIRNFNFLLRATCHDGGLAVAGKGGSATTQLRTDLSTLGMAPTTALENERLGGETCQCL
jgi:hypothetical protein